MMRADWIIIRWRRCVNDAAAGLRQRLARVEHARTNNRAFLQ